ncbi:ABC transporter permease subunit [Alteromonas sp. C1M14]|uniref:ABC transporter permease subunit n=1 Tax=Alteromonas sp. C1M14 TaxID=2841567 RepID=UPI001C09FC2E|nr:ABC transporter permease subunit [Alteromonas sp. C1M14]MBU2978545.1 ABC transporter permease subunit [Alteromonas sp. C1M14]
MKLNRIHWPSLSASTMVLGVLFLYTPIVTLIFYSFNGSERVNVWSEFSVHWYVELFANEALMSAVWTSLKLAVSSATMAVFLGTLASVALTRCGHFKGRYLFMGMITAPLVMPDVITGLSMLLLFVNMNELVNWPEGRGMLTIWIAHVTFCMAFVTIIISSRLRDVDLRLEDAARDLGAGTLTTFCTITLPIIAPALIAGWMLAFTLSLDDLVIASFVSGPSATTLPMVVFSSVRMGVSPQINALATLMILAVFITSLLSYQLVKKKAN